MSNSAETDAVQDRRNRLRELTEFTEACEKQIKELLQTLGWSPERSRQEEMEVREEMEVCPCDRGHRVPARSLEAHTTSCSLTKMGYPQQEQVQMCSSSEAGVRSFVMDKDTQHQVIQRARSAAPLMRMEGVFWQGQFSGRPVDVPHNHKRAVCDLTVADRLALYDHVVGVFRGQAEGAAAAATNEDLYVDLVSKLQKDEEQREPKTHLELMAEMRDYKRRRQSYRAKNVHITKKSYTEVIREVISVHSEELARQWREELEDEEGGALSEGSAHRRRSASSESRLSGGRRRRSRDRESKKKKKRRDSRSPELHKKKKKKKQHKEERQGRRSDSN